MTRMMTMAFGAVCYLIFFATFLYLVAFTGDFSQYVPRTVDTGPEATTATAAMINIVLIALFGVSHSVMARQGFKKWWTNIVPKSVERSVYVLVASLVLMVLYYFWRPMPDVVWATDSTMATILWALFFIGWGIALLSTFLINHFELFGLQQVWHAGKEKPAPDPQFREPFLYKIVRHPLYFGFLIAFWAIPKMTVGHMLLAAGMTIYIVIAIQYEEKDLIAYFGETYRDYKKRVGMLIPGIGKSG